MPLDPNLEVFVELVRGSAVRDEPEAIVTNVTKRMNALLRSGLRLDPRHRVLPPVGYGRNLVHRDVEAGFVVVSMVWPPGFRGLPHDHGTWGVVGVVEGEVEIVNFRRGDDGSDPLHVELVRTSGVCSGPGGTAHVLPPDEDFHSVSNASTSEGALTLHVYGREISSCTAVTLETGRAERMCPRYTSLPDSLAG